MRLIVRPAAAADLDQAFLWYEHQRSGLGYEFLDEANASMRAVALAPLRHAVLLRNTRRAGLHRFPYSLYYRVYGDVIVVVACLHGRRDPRQWQRRR